MSKVMEERAVQALSELALATAERHLDTVSQQAAAENWSYMRITVKMNVVFA